MTEAVRGRKYRVIKDSFFFFERGDIVVSLEDSCTPFCVREEDFREGIFNEEDYDSDQYNPLNAESELKEIKE